jgi:RNA polymerase sigma-70 factor (ECF subfamily)
MSETTVQLQGCLDRLRAGDALARQELFQLTCNRLTCLTRKMLHGGYGRLRQWEETEDVAQNARLRLMRALEQVVPSSVREFYGLASMHIRRELLDLCRHHFGRPGHGHLGMQLHDDKETPPDQANTTYSPEDLARWTELHERAQQLPAEEREAFDLLFYQELSQEEAAEICGVDKSTIKRRWRSARLKLASVLKGQ